MKQHCTYARKFPHGQDPPVHHHSWVASAGQNIRYMKQIALLFAGFRKDKIPLSTIIHQCGGQGRFKNACIEEVLTSTMGPAMEQSLKGDWFVPDSEKVRSYCTNMLQKGHVIEEGWLLTDVD